MIQYNEYVEEEAILLPIDTRFSIEVFLETTDDLMEPNRKGEYGLTFYPSTYQDYQRIQEIAAHAKSKVELATPMWSRKECQLLYEGSSGVIFTSQLHKPKLNIDLEPWDVMMLRGKHASLNLRFADTKLGKIYLVCDYVDLYEDPRIKPDVAPAVDIPEDDW
jgi:hypothetical protein